MRYLILAVLALACSGEPALRIQVDIASNQTGNPLLEIEEMRDARVSNGIKIILDPLICECDESGEICGPTSITAVADPSGESQIVLPTRDGPGMDATQSEFSVDPKQLDPDTFYQVRMVAQNVGTNFITHTGTGDCPVHLGLAKTDKDYKVTICFGESNPADPPICAASKAFVACPAYNVCN